MTLYLGVALVAAAVVLFLVQPVAKGLHASLEREDDEMTDTEARKRVALLALRDVEYDFLAGKLDEEDYRSLKAELTAEALAALEADDAAKSGVGGSFATADAALEDEIAAIRRGLRNGAPCPKCTYTNEAGSRFCSSCGTPLSELAAR
jgi:cytochrome c-type biogenesis protein CcmH/NrfG